MIGGTLFTHNCIAYDYCFEASLQSLLGVFDEISVVDAESADGTLERLREWERKDRRITVRTALWRPNALGRWLADLGNAARESLRSDYHIYLQADEVIHEASYPEMLECANLATLAWVHRFNFWRDAQHIAPPGAWCGHRIVRCAPTHVPVAGDCEGLDNRHQPQTQTGIRFFHYGTLRRAEAWAKKSRIMQDAYFGTHDPVIEKVELQGSDPLKNYYPADTLIPFQESHPAAARLWLIERGYIP